MGYIIHIVQSYHAAPTKHRPLKTLHLETFIFLLTLPHRLRSIRSNRQHNPPLPHQLPTHHNSTHQAHSSRKPTTPRLPISPSPIKKRKTPSTHVAIPNATYPSVTMTHCFSPTLAVYDPVIRVNGHHIDADGCFSTASHAKPNTPATGAVLKRILR